MAAFNQGLADVFFYVGRVPKHQIYHGKKALHSILLEEERKKVKISEASRPHVKRSLQTDLQFIYISKSQKSAVQFWDVAPKFQDSPLAGLDMFMKPVGSLQADLINDDVQDHKLKIGPSKLRAASHGVFSLKPVGEGEVVAQVKALWFTDPKFVKGFLKQPGNSRFADRLASAGAHITADWNGGDKRLYAVLLGAVGEINHASFPFQPNVCLSLASPAGPNPGALQFVCCTKARRGISSESELLLDYLGNYDLNLPLLVEESAPPKKQRIEDFFGPQPPEALLEEVDATEEKPPREKRTKTKEVDKKPKTQEVDKPEGAFVSGYVSAEQVFKSDGIALWRATLEANGQKHYFLTSDKEIKFPGNAVLMVWPGGTLRTTAKMASEFPDRVGDAVTLKVQSNTQICHEGMVKVLRKSGSRC